MTSRLDALEFWKMQEYWDREQWEYELSVYLDELDNPEPEETWRQIPGFPDYYISTNARIWSTISNKFMHVHISKTGYPSTTLRTPDGRHVTCTLHSLLGKTFLSDMELDPRGPRFVRHLDDNKMNYSLQNLRWGSLKDNIEDMRRNGNMFMTPIILTDLRTGEELEFPSRKEAADFLGISTTTLFHRRKDGSVDKKGYDIRYKYKR